MTTTAPFGVSAGSARYAENLCASPAVSSIITPSILYQAQFQFGFLRHPRPIPRRIEDQLHFHLTDTVDVAHGLVHPAQHFAGDRTARRGERHVDLDESSIFQLD